jgi:hypothetical protein
VKLDVLAMSLVQRAADLDHHLQRILGPHAALDLFGQVTTRQHLHAHVVMPLDHAAGIDRQDVVVRHRRDRVALLLQRLQEGLVAGGPRRDDLDRHLALRLQLAAEVNLGHTAAADLAVDLEVGNLDRDVHGHPPAMTAGS